MTYLLQLTIPIYDTVLSLAYSGVAARLCENFPEAVLAEEWSEIAEYERLETSLNRKEDPVPDETKSIMLRQMRSKHISNGPSLRFSLPASSGSPEITGIFCPWGIRFCSAVPFSNTDNNRIIAFLKSFGIGTVESDTWEDD